MLYEKPTKPFKALLTTAESGLVGTLGVEITDAVGGQVTARTTSGIVEAKPGNYVFAGISPGEEGDFLIVWDKGEGAENLAIEQLQVTRVLPFDTVVPFLPEPADVAAFLRARTYLDSGEQEGEFTADTRPTFVQVETLINQAANEVSARLGQEVEDDALRAFARNIVAIRAAMMIELSYFPEQADEDATTVYKELKSLYESELANLIEALPDTASTSKGIYSLRLRSDVSGVFPTSELLP
jgi:hypothetical protein